MKASNGLNIHLNHYESLLGRASMILGYDITAGNSQLNVYVKTERYPRVFRGYRISVEQLPGEVQFQR